MAAPIAEADRLDGLLACLACPICLGDLRREPEALCCLNCSARYLILGGIADLRSPASRDRADVRAWTAHWSEERQTTPIQRFFSFYRKAFVARSVRHFVGRYFPRTGIYLEAGSGTSETSHRIDKHNGAMTLLALDIIYPVLLNCDPIMDVRLCADIFQLPFKDCSLDGIWNVGVMEHFTHSEIDAILHQFYRVLKPGGRVILLWPATTSLPQKALHLIEAIVNIRRAGARFQFHPDEISQLRSTAEACAIMRRNGLHPVAIDNGLLTLMAFKTVVAERTATHALPEPAMR